MERKRRPTDSPKRNRLISGKKIEKRAAASTTPPRKRKRTEVVFEESESSASGYETERPCRKRKERATRTVAAGSRSKAPKTRMDDVLEAPTSDSSEGEGAPVNRFVGEKVQKRTTYYKSNLETTIKELQALDFSHDHIKIIKKTPFWLLFNAIWTGNRDSLARRCKKNEDDIRKILNCFDEKEGRFVIGGEHLEITARDVYLIFGVVGGSEYIPLKQDEYEIVDWVRRCFPKKVDPRQKGYYCYKGHILDKLENALGKEGEQHYKDVARLVHCYLLASLLTPCNNGSINWHITCYVESIEEMYRYDWSGLVIESLLKQLQKGKAMKVSGCTILLPFWFLELTSLLRPENDVAVPRFLKWNFPVLHNKLEKIDPYLLARKYLHKLCLNPTKSEKEILRKLKSKWDASYASMLESTRRREIENGEVSRNDVSDENFTQSEVETFPTVDLSTMNEGTPVRQPQKQYVRRSSERNKTANVIVLSSTVETKKTKHDSLDGGERRKHHSNSPVTSGALQMGSPSAEEQPTNSSVPETPLPAQGTNLEVQVYVGNENGNTINTNFGVICSAPSFNIGVTPDSRPGDQQFVLDQLVKSITDECTKMGSSVLKDQDNTHRPQDVAQHSTPLEEENRNLLKKLRESKLALLERDREVTRLRTELCNQRQDIESRMNYNFQKILCEDRIMQRTCWQAKFNTQEQYIVSLRQYVKELEHKYQKATEDPSTTQIMEDPETIERVHTIELLHTALANNRMLIKQTEENANGFANTDIPSGDIMGQVPHVSSPGAGVSNGDIGEASAGARWGSEKAVTTEVADKLTGSMERGQANNDTTPSVTPIQAKTTGKLGVYVTSMVKRIKGRTEMGDRKPVPISPEITTGELELVEVEDSPGSVVDLEPANPIFKIDDKFPAVRKTSDRVRTRLRDLWEKNGPSYELWRGENELSYVTLKDIVLLLHNERLDTKVVDSWGEILLENYSKFADDKPSLIFTSTSWDLIANCSETGSDLLKEWVDERVRKYVNNKHLLLFPILTKGEGRHPAGDHWTLLVLDLQKCEWRYYNSLSPRTKGNQDVHLTRSMVLVQYIDKLIVEHFRNKSPNHQAMKKGIKGPVSMPCPQQLVGSLDCGIVLCKNMEDIIQRKQPKKGPFSENTAGEYRKKMVEWFVEPVEINVE